MEVYLSILRASAIIGTILFRKDTTLSIKSRATREDISMQNSNPDLPTMSDT